jgi:hypothetical protein
MSPAEPRLRLRNLPGELRLVLGAFLVLAAAGYVAALVQVHYQAAGSGELLPGPGRVRERYSGSPEAARSTIERLLEADHGPLNASGTMRPAFTTESRGWASRTRDRGPDEMAKLLAEREGERLALLIWVRRGGDRAAYDRDDFFVAPDLTGQPVTPELLAGTDLVKIRSLIQLRCAECHSEGGRMERPRRFPLDTFERLKPYTEVQPSGQMTLPKLAQTTHVHLLGLSLLFVVTGALLCLTGLPREARLVLAPLPLMAQGIDIGCWWLARWDPVFAWGVVIGGAAAGLGLALHVGIGLWELVAARPVASGSDPV